MRPSSRAPPQRNLILHWDDEHWRRFPIVPGDDDIRFLSAVSADSKTDAWAVGYYHHEPWEALIWHWDGVSWSPEE